VKGDGPLAAALVLGPFTTGVLSALVTAAALFAFEKTRRFGSVLLGVRLAFDRVRFGAELLDSLRVKKREALGEQALERLPGLRGQ